LRTKNLDLVKAVEICKAAEITNKQMEILCTTSGRRTDEFQSVMGVRKTEDGQKKGTTSRDCKWPRQRWEKRRSEQQTERSAFQKSSTNADKSQ
jgi:hypothetical protein